jgi:hypothetical protein
MTVVSLEFDCLRQGTMHTPTLAAAYARRAALAKAGVILALSGHGVALMRPADPTPPHPEEHREAMRLEGWKPVMLLPTFETRPVGPLLRVGLSSYTACHERHRVARFQL